jgi:hypothetical protein
MWVHYSARFIFAPAVVAAFLGRWPDVVVIVAQAGASIWHHSAYSRLSLFADRLALAALAARTFSLAISTSATVALFILGFGYMLVMYTYGFCHQCYSFDPRPEVADKYHASIHVLGVAIYAGSMLFFLE